MGRVVPSTRSSCFRSSSSGRHRARSVSGAARPQREHVRLGCEFLRRGEPRHRVKEAQRRNLRGSAVALRGLLGPPASHETQKKEDVRQSQLQDVHEPGETCDANVYHEFDCAGTLRELLQKEVALIRDWARPTPRTASVTQSAARSARGFS